MDSLSHILFGTSILSKCNLDTAYAPWSNAPDIDLYTLLHRYTFHRFSNLDKLQTKFTILNPSIPHTDKTAISIAILSHFYLDIFNGFIFCWGLRCPSLHVPPHIATEYIDDFNYNLLHNKSDEASETFYSKSQSLFDTLPTMTTDEAFTFLISNLARYTPFRPTPNRAISHLQSFTNTTIHYIPGSFALPFTSKYYSFLNSFFEKY